MGGLMIRMFQSQTAGHAKSYFRDALSKADYYINDQELNGTFNGRIAHKLGLEGQLVNKETFEKLCDNINPKDGGSLTPRTVKDRRVGYDISFHAPKSVSIVHALSDDDKIMQAFKTSVHETMNEMELDMQTRIRSQGQYDDRSTDSLLWTDFIYQTARPVDGHPPDPHLHCHCFTFNVTYDEVENRYKAGQFHNIKRDMPYYQARFQKRLADTLSKMGYGIRKTRSGFELAVVPQKAIDHFCKRTNLIGQVAKEKGIVNRTELDKLGAKTRGKKQKSLSMPQLQVLWRKQLEENEIAETTRSETRTTDKTLTTKRTINHAIDHVFTRSSVKRERQILSEAYLHAIDNKVISMESLDKAFKKDDRVFKIKSGNEFLCTTALVLKEERKMVELARKGIGKFRPFNPLYESGMNKYLGYEQEITMDHILKSQDRLTMIRGGAGTGKTTLIKYAIGEIERNKKNVILLAPTADAAHEVLKNEGFKKTDTVARFLKDKKLQEQSVGQVIWIDEAGMLGTKDMADILGIAQKNNARVILSGDPRQHSAVNRGDAMRILKTVGQIPQASLEHIYRQREDRYKAAVEHISKGNILSGFKQLENMNAIQEIDYTSISNRLTDDYLKVVDGKKSVLVISPTKDQAQKVNAEIRKGLKERGKVYKREKSIIILDNLHLTDTQKKDARSYQKGDVIQAHQNLRGLKRGGKAEIDRIEDKNVYLRSGEKETTILDLSRAAHFDVYRKREITLSKGDEIRITKNSFDENKQRINNGTVLNVNSIDKEGRMTVYKKSKSKNKEFILPADFGNLDYAYCSTSYIAQGKTVDHVLINQPSTTFPASNQKQFYVSVSRGREGVQIYTDDKESVLTQIQKTGDRQGATELIGGSDVFPKTRNIQIVRENLDFEKTIKPNKEYEPDL
ncbi:MobF family relaxase [Flagellimonas onchidii]|uniref:MobF family relaxase n=1 Tax=Flagellimonas onchidii TaxID=2562684 RepID=UPI0010A67EFD|nr:MobF family relaxase [Allomuricauda onchidii]